MGIRFRFSAEERADIRVHLRHSREVNHKDVDLIINGLEEAADRYRRIDDLERHGAETDRRVRDWWEKLSGHLEAANLQLASIEDTEDVTMLMGTGLGDEERRHLRETLGRFIAIARDEANILSGKPIEVTLPSGRQAAVPSVFGKRGPKTQGKLSLDGELAQVFARARLPVAKSSLAATLIEHVYRALGLSKVGAVARVIKRITDFTEVGGITGDTDKARGRVSLADHIRQKRIQG